MFADWSTIGAPNFSEISSDSGQSFALRVDPGAQQPRVSAAESAAIKYFCIP